MADPAFAAVLTIDLDAIRANWRQLAERTAPAQCAAVVKADAYGLGAARVAPALARAGCRQFFVAQLGEGIALRQALREKVANATIFVLNGIMESERLSFDANGLVPCLNDLGQVERWSRYARRRERALPAALQPAQHRPKGPVQAPTTKQTILSSSYRFSLKWLNVENNRCIQSRRHRQRSGSIFKAPIA